MTLTLVSPLIDNVGVQMPETEKMRPPWMAAMPVPRTTSQQDDIPAFGVGTSPPSSGQVGLTGTRLLPWTGEGGQPAYLSTGDGDSYVSRLADGLESVQLTMAERLLHNTESAWADRHPGADMAGVVPHLCHALRDALRVARSLRERLPVPAEDDRSALADAALAREIAPYGTDGTALEGVPPTAGAGPWTVAYRWPGDPVCVGAVRRALRRHLDEWGMTALADTAGLVLSELATNSVRHASGTDGCPIETRFERLVDGSLRIEVHDPDTTRPQRKAPPADAASGRGLILVDVLTAGRWGVSDRVGVGKLTWALVCAPDRTGHDHRTGDDLTAEVSQ